MFDFGILDMNWIDTALACGIFPRSILYIYGNLGVSPFLVGGVRGLWFGAFWVFGDEAA